MIDNADNTLCPTIYLYSASDVRRLIRDRQSLIVAEDLYLQLF
jgi:hypothetical protein